MLEPIKPHMREAKRYDYDVLRQYLVGTILHRSHEKGYENVPPKHAEIVADACLRQDARHTFSHGGNLGDQFNVSPIGTDIDPTAKPQVVREKYGGVQVWSGHRVFGMVSAYYAAEAVREMVRTNGNGSAEIFVHMANHGGAMGEWSRQIARDGDMFGQVTCTAHAGVILDGGLNPTVGTNAYAETMPGGPLGTYTLDIATAEHALNYAFLAINSGWEKFPFRIGRLVNGKVVESWHPSDFGNNIVEFRKTARGLPLGWDEDPKKSMGYKGAGLAWMTKARAVAAGETPRVISSDAAKRGEQDYITMHFRATLLDALGETQITRPNLDLMVDEHIMEAAGLAKYPGQLEDLAWVESSEHGVLMPPGNIRAFERMGQGVPDLPELIGRKNTTF